MLRTFDDGQGAPLTLAPSRAHEPLLHARHQRGQVLRVGAHHLVELGEFAGAKEHLGQAEAKVGVAQLERFEQGLQEETTNNPII